MIARSHLSLDQSLEANKISTILHWVSLIHLTETEVWKDLYGVIRWQQLPRAQLLTAQTASLQDHASHVPYFAMVHCVVWRNVINIIWNYQTSRNVKEGTTPSRQIRSATQFSSSAMLVIHSSQGIVTIPSSLTLPCACLSRTLSNIFSIKTVKLFADWSV